MRNMSILRFLQDAEKLAGKRVNIRVRERFVTADGVDIDLYVFHVLGEGRLHTCGRDGFF